MGELAQAAKQDVNADGYYTEEDVFGAIIWDDIMMGLVAATENRVAVINKEGQLELTFWNESILSAFEKFTSWAYEDGVGYAYQRYPIVSACYKMIGNGHSLFLMHELDELKGLRQYETDIGLLPMPKLSEEQATYGHMVAPYGTVVITVPALQRDLSFTANILEAFARKSYDLVTPAYFEKVLVGRGLRDYESEVTLNIILNSRVYDMGLFFNAQLGMGDVCMNPFRSKTTNFASTYKSKEASALSNLEKINKTFAELLEQEK